MADDYIITYTLKLEPGDVAAKAGAAGKQAGDAFGAAFKPDIQLTKAFDADKEAKKIVGSFKTQFQGMNLATELEKSLSGANFARTDFAKSLKDSLQDVVGKTQVQPAPGVAPHAAPEHAGASIAQQLHPLVSGLEAFSMLLRGAPLLSVAQMVGQAVTGLQELRRTRAAAEVADAIEGRTGGGGPIFLPGRRAAAAPAAAAETEAARIERRLQGIPGTGAGPPPVPPGLMSGTGLMKIGGAAGAAGAVFAGLTEVDRIIIETAKHAAEGNLHFHDMAETLGLTSEEFTKMETKWTHAGVNFQEFGRTFLRVAVQAQRAMPAIQREVEDSDNKVIESAFKVRDAERGVEKARDNRQASVERVKISEGELAKFEATRAQERQQQAEAAALAVSGAQIGLRGAEMQRRQADIQRQYAPQEAALVDIQGKQTVKGAELGTAGARIALEEARARSEGRDPSQDQDLQFRKQQLALRTARHNFDQAELHEKQVKMAEEKRQTMVGAGVGPEAQAEQAQRAAEQAEQQAQLHVRQVDTAERGLRISQETHTLEIERNERLRATNAAKHGEEESAQQQVMAGITLQRSTLELARMRYTEIPSVKAAIQAQISGEPFEGYKFGQVSRDVMQKTLFEMGGGEGGKAFDVVGEFLRALPGKEGQHTPERMKILTDFLGGGRGGQAQAQEIATALLTEPQHRTPEQQAELDKRDKEEAERRDANRAIAENAKRNIAIQERESRREKGAAEFETTKEMLPGALKRAGDTDKTLSSIQKFTLQTVNDMEKGNEAFNNYLKEFGKSLLPSNMLGDLTKRREELKPTGEPTPVKVEETAPVKVEKPTVTSDKPEAADTFSSRFSGAGEQAAGAVNSAGSELANALRQKASEIAAVQITAPSALPKGREGTEGIVTEQAQGGPIHGAGTGTSDSIPINASAGEFIVTADGSNLKDAMAYFGVRGFAGGGEVTTETKKGGYLETMQFLNNLIVDPHTDRKTKNELIDLTQAMSPVGQSITSLEKHLDRLGNFAEGGAVGKKDDLGSWAAIIKSSQWGAWLAKMGLPALGVAIPAAADVALGYANPAISALLALKAVWDETHDHPPMTLGEVLREQRGGLSVNESMAKQFAENRQATFEERFSPPEPEKQDTFDDRFGFQSGGPVGTHIDPDTGFLVDANGKVIYEGSVAERERNRLGLGRPTGSGWSFASDRTKQKSDGGGGSGGDVNSGARAGTGAGGGSAIMPIRIASGPAPAIKVVKNPYISGGGGSAPGYHPGAAPGTEGSYADSTSRYGPSKIIPNPYVTPNPYADQSKAGSLDSYGRQSLLRYGPALVRPNPYADPSKTTAEASKSPGGIYDTRFPHKFKFIENPYFKDYGPATTVTAEPPPAETPQEQPPTETKQEPPPEETPRPSQAYDPRQDDDPENQDYARGGLIGMAEGGGIDERSIGEQGSVSDKAFADSRIAISDRAFADSRIAVSDKSFADSRIAVSDKAYADPRGEAGALSDKDFARLSFGRRRGFAAGGPVGNEAGAISKTGGAVSEAEFANLSRAAVPDKFVQDAMADLSRRMVQGFTDPIASNYSNATALMMRGGGGAAMPSAYHQLDLVTPAGRFNAAVSENTILNIQRSSLGDKMVQTGPRPTWYS